MKKKYIKPECVTMEFDLKDTIMGETVGGGEGTSMGDSFGDLPEL